MQSLQSWSGLSARVWREVSRRDPDDPYAWTMAHRSLGGRPLLDLPPLQAIIRDRSSLVVIQKSAQVGLTELLISQALWAASTGYAGRGRVLLLMPTDAQMRDFAQMRVDAAIQGSAHLQALLRPEPPRRRGADSTRVKQFPTGAIFMRGAESLRNVASVDADMVLLDEFDQMNDGVLERAQRRIASSQSGQVVVASTPRYPETGVNGLYLQSDQHRYYLPCPGCGLEQPLTWEENVDHERAAVVCRACREPIDVLGPGRWVAEAPGNAIRGYHLSRLYSPWVDLAAMIDASDAPGLHAAQAFYNEDLGEVFSPPGGSVTLDMLDGCRGEYRLGQYAGETTVAGVDVGRVLHVVIRQAPRRPASVVHSRPQPAIPAHYIDSDTGQPPPSIAALYNVAPPTAGTHSSARRDRDAPGRLVYAGTVASFDELDALMMRFHVGQLVIDAQPETRAAQQFAARHPGRVALARYDRHGADIDRDFEGGARMLHVDRTYVLDAMLEGFREGRALLPANARGLGGRVRQGIGEYYRQMTAPKRVIELDSNGTPVARWTQSRDDHYAHAEVYAMLAAGEIHRGRVTVYE